MEEIEEALDSLNNLNNSMLTQVNGYREALSAVGRTQSKQYEALSELNQALQDAIQAIIELG